MGMAIAVLLTLAMLGSVLWVMPSPREKALTAMRQQAMAKGIKVRLLDQKQADKLYPWIENHRGYVTYELNLKGGQKWPVKQAIVVPVDQSSVHELDRDSALYERLAKVLSMQDLPSSVEALVFYSACVAVLWREDDHEHGVERVAQALNACLELDAEVFAA